MPQVEIDTRAEIGALLAGQGASWAVRMAPKSMLCLSMYVATTKKGTAGSGRKTVHQRKRWTALEKAGRVAARLASGVMRWYMSEKPGPMHSSKK